jgi:molybdopterin/thiamine biosynthesis adenylyltransferase
MVFSDASLLRYSRHLLLDGFGIEGQQRLAQSRVLVVGVGGLGCPAAQYLAAAGVGHLVLADHDTVDLTNLQRQILHTTHTVGQPKVQSAAAALHALNPEVCLELLPGGLGVGGEQAQQTQQEQQALALLHTQVQRADVVLDCSDNFTTRDAINRACVLYRKPLVSGAAIRHTGQLAVFALHKPDAPCYHCVFPEGDAVDPERCATTGVFAPLTGLVGTLQAAEAIKILAHYGQPCFGQLLKINALLGSFQTVQLQRDPACVVCAL